MTERHAIQLGPGLTLSKARERREEIAKGLGLPLRAVRVEATPDSRVDRAVIAVTREDPFKQKIWWKGPHLPGESIAARVDFATAEDAERVGLYYPGSHADERNAQHWMWMGMPGSGKGYAALTIYGSVLCRREVCVIMADCAKGLQTAGPLVEGLTWFVGTETGTNRLIKNIPRLMHDRTQWLADRGLMEWETGCGLEYLIIHIEESAGVARHAFIKLAERARSAGISLVLSQQRSSSDRMNTSVRYNLGGSLCFGVRDTVDAKFALMNQTIEAGAHPEYWQNRKRGQFYMECDGVDVHRFPVPNKVDWLYKLDIVREAVAYGAQFRATISDVSARALGHEFAAYHRDKVNGKQPWRGIEPVVVDMDSPRMEKLVAANEAADPSVSEARVSTAAADAILKAWIADQRAAGHETFSFTQAKLELLPRVERSATWLNLRFARMIKLGLLPAKRGDNEYQL